MGTERMISSGTHKKRGCSGQATDGKRGPPTAHTGEYPATGLFQPFGCSHPEPPPTGNAANRDSISAKVFEGERVGFGEGGGNVLQNVSSPLPNPYFPSVAAMASRACSMRKGCACVPMWPRRKTLPSIGPKLPVQMSP